MPTTKIATCCYCGSHAALSLTGDRRHELACATCGAPISRLKQLPLQQAAPRPVAAAPARPRTSAAMADPRARKAPKKQKKSRSFARKAWGEIWDVVEDIFD